MKKILIITGGNRGLGEAIINLALNDEDTFIISLSRSLSNQHLEVSSNKLLFIKVDLIEPFESGKLNAIDKYVNEDSTLLVFNNAGIILPISRVGDLKQEDISRSIRVNVEYPINLVNWVLQKYISNKLIFVNITSGAANKPIAHWSLYSSSKAFIQMFFNNLNEENANNKNLLIYNIDPGTMDTEMQTNIRSNEFPKQGYFQSLKDAESLIKPHDAAVNILKQIGFGI